MITNELIKKLSAYGADTAGIVDRFMGDAEFYEECFHIFVREQQFDLLEQAMASKNYDAAFQAGHALKGMSGNLGLTPFYVAIVALLDSLRTENYSNITIEYDTVLKQLQQLQALLSPEEAAAADIGGEASSSAGQTEIIKPDKTPTKLLRKDNLPPPQRMKIITFCLVALVGIAIIASIFIFAVSYRQLINAIQVERTDYVDEISTQIINCQHFMEKEYSEIVLNYADILNNNEIATMADLRRYCGSKIGTKILLADTSGRFVDSDENPVYFEDRSLAAGLGNNERVPQLFATLNSTEDYWLFAAPLNSVEINGISYMSVILAISADTYRNALAVSLFDGRGASYIVKPSGIITVKPIDNRNNLGGYNLFAAMTKAGADEAEIASFAEEFINASSGSRIFTIAGEQWLVSYSNIEGQDERIVVTVPLTITAAQTYDGLSTTIFSASAMVFGIAILAVIFILYFTYRDKKRSREAMAVEAKSNFFSKMSHDMRTPLNAIIGLQTLALDSNDINDIKEYLADSSVASSYLLSIINDVLDISRIEKGKLSILSEPFTMNSLIADIVTLITPMAAEKNLSFNVEMDVEAFDMAYLGDALHIKQILVNLLNNAVKFTKANGCIVLKVDRSKADHTHDDVTLAVSDTGIGMSKQYLSRIFTPFEQEQSSYTQQYAGSGLGLAIAHNLVTLMGGTITLDSIEGKGSTFSVCLPFERIEKHLAIEKAPPLPTSSFSGKRVLLVEDNAINRKVAVALLKQKCDISSDIAANGSQALAAFSASTIGYYDLILMDVKMPVMDGLEATRHIRALPRPDAKKIPIIALSANAFTDDIALSLEAGMNDHLAKPIDIAALLTLLEKYLH